MFKLVTPKKIVSYIFAISLNYSNLIVISSHTFDWQQQTDMKNQTKFRII